MKIKNGCKKKIGSKNVTTSRKERRKQERKQKKARKHEFFQRKKTKIDGKNINVSKTPKKTVVEKISLEHDNILQKQKKEQKKAEKAEKKLKELHKVRVRQLSDANRQEDKIIKKLEKQLKLNRRKSKTIPKSFTEDGLDYLLDICDENTRQQAIAAEKNIYDQDSDFEEDLVLAANKLQSKDHEASDEDNSTDDGLNSNSEDEELFNKSDSSDTEGETADNGGRICAEDDDDEMSTSCDNDESQVMHTVAKCKRKKSAPPAEHKKIIIESKNKNQIEEKRCTSLAKLSENVKKCKNEKICNKKTHMVDNDTSPPDNKKKRKLDRMKNKKLHHAEEDCEPEMNSDDNISDYSNEDFTDEEETPDETMTASKKKVLWEDIYGRTRDEKGNIVQKPEKYVPPHMRSQGSVDSKKQESLQRLRKLMKGLLNRLAESNMNSIANQLEELYMSYSRNDMNETLTSLMLESLVTPVITPERLVMEHAALIAILHSNVGTEVGAHFLQVLSKKFDEMLKQEQNVENKVLDNVTMLLSHLYNFKIFHSILMYDILEILAETFGEKEIELILLILRSVGFSLRKDDPLALKNLILKLQKKAVTVSQNNSRVKFMLDILLAIKNNNMSKIPNYDTTHSEHLKKLLKSFLRKGNYITELKISLEDLLKVEERGRWWVVGSAWTGVLPGESDTSKTHESSSNMKSPVVAQYSQQLLDLARKQRMNTDVRRNIFCIIMSAEDYLDAFEKLLHLGLKNLQEREIIYVLIDCCLQEKEFNPYYAFIAQKFCEFDRKYQMTIQYFLWDKLKELHSLNLQQTSNLAKFISYLFLEKGLPISVLKVVQFVDVDKPTVRFLRQVLMGVLLHKSEDACLQVFQRVAVAPKLSTFRESLRLFIHHFLLRKTGAISTEDTALLEARANHADKILAVTRSHVDL